MTDRIDPSLAVRSFVAGLAGVAGSYAVAGPRPGFVAAPIDAILARTMPGVVVTLAIELLGKFGQRLNFATAVLIAVVLFALAARAGLRLGDWADRPAAGVAFGGGLAWLIAALLTGAPVVALGAGLGVAVAVGLVSLRVPDAIARRTDDVGDGADAGFDAHRRVALAALGAVVLGAIGVAVRGLPFAEEATPAGRSDGDATAATGSGLAALADPAIDDLLEEAASKSLDVRNLEPLVSDRFYEVDINSVNPSVDAGSWTLSITGAVETEEELTYADLTGMAAEHRFITLRCVGESLNGSQMDNALWTGVPIRDCIDMAGPQGTHVMLRAADGYFEEFPVEALRNGFLAYGMNGQVLPVAHGYPVRALIPGHWGEINVKWLTEIEVLDGREKGYWERRGWHGTGPVETVAKLHAVDHLDDGRNQVGGHAYAGTRGVDRVEVSIDGAETWTDAQLSEPLPGEDVWRQWTFVYTPPDRTHDVVVRAIEPDGTVQPREPREPFPRGAAGWVRRTIRP